jgi:hypothetical protein
VTTPSFEDRVNALAAQLDANPTRTIIPPTVVRQESAVGPLRSNEAGFTAAPGGAPGNQVVNNIYNNTAPAKHGLLSAVKSHGLFGLHARRPKPEIIREVVEQPINAEGTGGGVESTPVAGMIAQSVAGGATGGGQARISTAPRTGAGTTAPVVDVIPGPIVRP